MRRVNRAVVGRAPDVLADRIEGLLAVFCGWLYDRFRARYLAALGVAEGFAAVGICIAAAWLLARYRPMSAGQFAELVAASSGFTLVMLAAALWRVWPVARPVVGWANAEPGVTPQQAWCGAVDLPLGLVSRAGLPGAAAGLIPSVASAMLILRLPWSELPILLALGAVALAYGLVLHVFALELALRPVVRDIARRLPPAFAAARPHLSLRWKLLIAIPLINLCSGVAVSALLPGVHHSLGDLGDAVLVSALIAVTVAFLLTAVVGGSILGAVGELAAGTRRVRQGELTGRVAVSATDELGRLGDMFNEMIAGLSEREVLRDALGTYVHPSLADRIIRGGLLIPGEELDVTIVFVDLIGFTSLADRVDPASAVAHINTFLADAIPVISRHGGHVDTFIGDGLLAVFGAPDRLTDHADRGLAAAYDIARMSARATSPWRAGVGVNSGRALAGTIGAEHRYEYTVIGDVVNVASRIERATRELDQPLLVGAATRDRLADATRLVPHGTLDLRGKRDPVAVYAPIHDANDAPS